MPAQPNTITPQEAEKAYLVAMQAFLPELKRDLPLRVFIARKEPLTLAKFAEELAYLFVGAVHAERDREEEEN